MKVEVTVAPLSSVRTGWYSARACRVDAHHGNGRPGALLYNQVQSGFCSWRLFTREGFCSHFDTNGLTYSTQRGCSSFHISVCVRDDTPVFLSLLLYVCTHHDGQQNILEVVSETQRVAAEQGKVSLQELQDETEGHSVHRL